MRLCINLRLRAALIAATSLLLSYTIPDAQAVGVSESKTDLSSSTIGSTGTGGYTLEEIASLSNNGDPVITKLVYNPATGQYTPVYYRVNLANLGTGTANDKTYKWVEESGVYSFKLSSQITSGTVGSDSYTVYYDPSENERYTSLVQEAALVASFVGLSAPQVGTYSQKSGGAISLEIDPYKPQKVGGIKGDFIANSALAGNGGAIYILQGPSGTYVTLGLIEGNFISNKAAWNGGAINIDADVGDVNVKGDFIRNSANYGGAIIMGGFVTGDFIQNYATKNGGAIYSNDYDELNIYGDFYFNSADGSGGAIDGGYNGSINVHGDLIGNRAKVSGGAVYIDESDKIAFIALDRNVNITGNFVGDSYLSTATRDFTAFKIVGAQAHFNAYGTNKITVNDGFSGGTYYGRSAEIHINSGKEGSGGSQLTNINNEGKAFNTVELNSTITDIGNIIVYGGKLKLGEFAGTTLASPDGSGTFTVDATHAMLVNSGLTINADAHLETNASYLGEVGNSNTVTNSGDIDFVGTGVLNTTIDGTGDIEITESASVTATLERFGTNTLTNEGRLVLTGTETVSSSILGTGIIEITSTGNVSIVKSAYTSGHSFENAGTLNLFSDTWGNSISNTGTIIIDENSEVITNASLITTTGAGTGRIDGTLEFTGGTVAHSWTGEGTLVVGTGSSVSSSANYLKMGSTQIDGDIHLTGGTVKVALSGNGKLIIEKGVTVTSSAEYLKMGSTQIDGDINLTGGTVEAVLSGNGKLVIGEDVTVNSSANYLKMDDSQIDGEIYLTEGTLTGKLSGNGKLSTSDGLLITDASNINLKSSFISYLELTGGTLELYEGATVSDFLIGGRLTISGDVISKQTLSGLGRLYINSDASLTIDAGLLYIGRTSAAVSNAGTIELTGGTLARMLASSGDLLIRSGNEVNSDIRYLALTGSSQIDGTLTLTGTGNLAGSYTGDGTLRIDTDANITTSADKLVIDDINVNGILTLNGGTLNAALMSGPSFTGDGKLVIAAEQTVTMEKTSFTARPQINVATTEVNGTLALSATDVSTNDDFTINGTLSIVGSSTIDGSMQGEGSINISASTQLSMDANAIASSKGLTINNSGTLKLRGTGEIDRTIGGSGIISLLSGDDLTTRADFYGTTNSIESSYGILRLTTGTLTHLISGSTDIYIHSGNTVTTSIDTFNYNTENDFFIEGTLALTGTGTLSKILDDDVYYATLGAGTVQITEGSDITADLSYLKSNIELDGDLTITNLKGENKLMAALTGTGTLTVNEGTTEFYTTADNLRMDTLYNDGTITLSGELTGTTTAGTLDTTLLGNGEVIIKSKTTMNADVLDTTNTITNNSTIVLTGGTLNKSVEGGGALEILSGASVSMGRQYLEDYYTITTDGTLLITGGGTIAKDISGEGYVTINAPTTLSSTITSGFGAIIDETNSGSLHVTSSGSILGIGSYALNLTGDISLADRFITWDDEAGMLDRESLQASFHLTYNGQYNPFVNITQDGNSYSLSVYEVGAYDPLSGYYLEAKADGVSGNAFVLSDYKYGSAADAESYVKFRGTVGDDYSQEADPSLKSRAASYVWKTDAEGNVYLDELSTHSAGADVYAYSRNNEEVAFWKLDPPDWDENPNPEFNRSFIGFKDGDLQAFYFVSEWRTVKQIDGDFIDNSHSKYSLYSPAYGGAMHLARNVTVTKVNSNFVGNRAHHTDSTTTGGFDTRGGAIYAHSSNIGDIVGNFIGNAAYSYSQHETGTVLTTSHKAEGGAIFLDEDASIGSITGDFVGNYAVSRNDNYRYEYYKASGGALRLQVGATIDSIEGNFTQNYSSAGHFVTGGAISLISKANIKNITGNFYGNYATTQVPGSESILPGGEYEVKWAKGGAISMEDGHISNIEGDFEMNKAISSQDSQGGAIHIEDLKGEQRDITILGDFKGNASIADEYAYGGAMFYHDYLIRSISYDATVDDYMDLQYKAGLVEITGDFIGNYASGKDNAYGGAIYNHGGEISILAEEKDSSVLFEGNYTTLDGGVTKEYNAIHNTARNNEYVDAAPAVVNFEATGDNVIVVNDSINGFSTEKASNLHLRNWQVLNINLKANAAGATGDYSRVEFNNHVSDQTVNVYGGELRLGNDGRTRSTTPSSMLQRVNLTVFNTAKVEAEKADSLGNGDNNILVTEEGYLNMHAGTLRNDVTADMEGIIHIQEGVTIDSILTIEDGATVRGTAGVDSRLEYVTLGVNSEVNGQAIAMEHGTIELTTTGAIAQTTVEDYTVNYITVAAKADIYEIKGSLTLNINTINEEITLKEFINGLYGKGVLLNDYEGISVDVLAADLNIEESVYININGTNIAVTSVQNLNEGILFVLTPEPSTATLSLLALTALLARRRRTRV